MLLNPGNLERAGRGDKANFSGSIRVYIVALIIMSLCCKPWKILIFGGSELTPGI